MLRRFFCSRRLRLWRGGTEVFTRGFGLASDRRIMSASLERAMVRFLAWLRVSETWITTVPSRVQRWPAMCLSRRFAASVNEGERAAAKRSSTAVATLFTFCPPGPEARTNCSEISHSPSSMSGVIHIGLLASMIQATPAPRNRRIAAIQERRRAADEATLPSVLEMGQLGTGMTGGPIRSACAKGLPFS